MTATASAPARRAPTAAPRARPCLAATAARRLQPPRRGFWRGRPEALDRALCDAALFNGTADDLELEYRLSGEIDDAAPFAFDLPPTAGAVADADAALSAACDARGFDHGACDRIRGPILDDLRGLLGPKAVHDVRLCARDGEILLRLLGVRLRLLGATLGREPRGGCRLGLRARLREARLPSTTIQSLS